MQFLNPLAWWLLFVLLPIALFYVLRTRAKRQTVATILFWQQVFEERRSRAFWRQLRHLLSLLLSLLFAALLIAAILDPVESSTQAERTVIVFDNSASMNALDSSGKSRFDEALKQAGRLIRSADGRKQTAIITTCGTPQLACGFSSHFGTLQKAINEISQTNLPGTLSDAIAMAEFLAQHESGHGQQTSSRIFVITDGNEAIAEKYLSQDNIQRINIGKSVGNVAITKFQPRRSMSETLSFDILLETANFSQSPVECQVEITLNGDTIDIIPLSLAPGTKERQIVTASTASGGKLRARLEIIPESTGETEDALVDDNKAEAVLPARRIQKILFFGNEDFFLIRVLASQLHVELARVNELPETIPADSVLVIHRKVPEKLPGGNVFVIDPQNGCDDFSVGELLDVPVIEKSETDSSLLRSVRLENTLLHGARNIAFPDANPGLHVLLETPDKEPIYINRENGMQKLLLLSTEIARSELAMRTAFPIMFAHALAYFRNDSGEWERTSGICESESDLRLTADFSDIVPQQASAISVFAVRPIWFWLAFAALIFTAFEWHLYQRRWID